MKNFEIFSEVLYFRENLVNVYSYVFVSVGYGTVIVRICSNLYHNVYDFACPHCMQNFARLSAKKNHLHAFCSSFS